MATKKRKKGKKGKPARPALERNSRKLLALLKQDGWEVVKTEGSHHKLRNPKFKHFITLAHSTKDLPTGTLRQIYKAAGWL
jgi:predicted RNA binding protein YcfA (HicA-like mRNA interferase family)